MFPKPSALTVSEKKIKEVIDFRQGYYAKLSQLRRLMTADPQPYGGIENVLLSYPLQMPINTGVEPWEEVLDLAIEEIKERIEKKEGILPAGAPKLMFQIMPYVQPWISKMFEENGVLLSGGGATKKTLSPAFLRRSFYGIGRDLAAWIDYRQHWISSQ